MSCNRRRSASFRLVLSFVAWPFARVPHARERANSLGGKDPDLVMVSFPAFEKDRELLGALTISTFGPVFARATAIRTTRGCAMDGERAIQQNLELRSPRSFAVALEALQVPGRLTAATTDLKERLGSFEGGE